MTQLSYPRKTLVVLFGVFALMVSALPALGAPPSNDTFEGRTVIQSLPFSEVLDTSEATTDEFDAAAGAQCQGPPATDAAVWYEVTVTEDSIVTVDLSGTDYTAGVLVFSGNPIQLEDCAPGGIEFFALAGVPHYLMIIDDQGDEGGNGGELHIAVDSFLPPMDEVCPGIFLDDPSVAGLNVVMGTEGNDVLVGTNGPDLIVGLGGDDHISGLGGDDQIAGCDGDDTIDAGSGDDLVTGDSLDFFGDPGASGGNDIINGGSGNDELLGGAGDDTIDGGSGNDGVIGNQGDDYLNGGPGDDFVAGGFGEDHVDGGNGEDFVSGGWDSDTVIGGNGKDFLNGAAPAFGPGEEPDVGSVDVCVGENGKDEVINCEA